MIALTPNGPHPTATHCVGTRPVGARRGGFTPFPQRLSRLPHCNRHHATPKGHPAPGTRYPVPGPVRWERGSIGVRPVVEIGVSFRADPDENGWSTQIYGARERGTLKVMNFSGAGQSRFCKLKFTCTWRGLERSEPMTVDNVMCSWAC